MEKSCITTGSYMSTGINVAIHVLILFTILSMFFMFYVAPMERMALNGEIKNNIDKLITFDSAIIPDEYKPFLKSDILQKLKNSYTKPHKLVETHNEWLFKTIILTNVSLFIVVTLSTLLLLYQCNQCLPIGHILLENGLTFLFVGLVEYLFFTRVALHYIPSKPSAMANSFFESLEKNL